MKTVWFSRLGLRGRLLASIVGAIALVLALLTVSFNVVLGNRLDRDANNVVEARASAEVAALHVVNGHIVLPEAPDEGVHDSQIWVFDGQRVLERPSAAPDENERAAAARAEAAGGFREVSETQTRMYSAPVVQNGRRVGTVVAGVSLRPYEQTERTAVIASVLLALIVLLAVALAARWLISRALEPVGRITRQAADWSERDLDRRFAVGQPRDEITQLAGTLDGLLDRLAASLRREQRFSAELSHELRTPLSNVIAEAQFALRHARDVDDYRAGFEQVLQSARQMSRTLEALIVAARAELHPQRARSDVVVCARAAIEACAAAAARRGIELSLVAPRRPATVAAEADLVERILAPLLDNACRFADRAVRVEVEPEGATLLCTVTDDGPGVPAADREAIFEPGRRSAAPASAVLTAQGAGLGLALARRLARSAGGEVTAAGSHSGARFVVRLPRA
jgi:two-component system, OmpR family, sensor kinase